MATRKFVRLSASRQKQLWSVLTDRDRVESSVQKTCYGVNAALNYLDPSGEFGEAWTALTKNHAYGTKAERAAYERRRETLQETVDMLNGALDRLLRLAWEDLPSKEEMTGIESGRTAKALQSQEIVRQQREALAATIDAERKEKTERSREWCRLLQTLSLEQLGARAHRLGFVKEWLLLHDARKAARTAQYMAEMAFLRTQDVNVSPEQRARRQLLACEKYATARLAAETAD